MLHDKRALFVRSLLELERFVHPGQGLRKVDHFHSEMVAFVGGRTSILVVLRAALTLNYLPEADELSFDCFQAGVRRARIAFAARCCQLLNGLSPENPSKSCAASLSRRRELSPSNHRVDGRS